MTPTQRAAMEQALGCLVRAESMYGQPNAAQQDQLRAALAEPAVQEPRNHVGNSSFESWYADYDPIGKGDKQRARDAYAAGMGDPVYLPAPVQEPIGWYWEYNGRPEGKVFFANPPDQDVIERGLSAEFPCIVRYVYAAPQAQQPAPPADVPMLTPEEIDAALHVALPSLSYDSEDAFITGVRVGEKAVRQKAGMQ